MTKNFFHSFYFFGLLCILPACFSSEETPPETPVVQETPPEDVPDDVPDEVASAAPLAVDQNLVDLDPSSEIFLSLQYTDLNSDLATACAITDLTYLTETTPCSCSEGVCMVGVTHNVTYTGGGWGEFNFTVTANSEVSNLGNVYMTTKCTSPDLATGASLLKDSSSCPNYSGWTGTISPSDILVMQDGNVPEGGFVLAFDSSGCFKGRATSKETPWYGLGLKVQAYANSITTNNEVKLVMTTLVNATTNKGVYEWDLPYTSQTKTLDSRTSGLSNAATIPDDDNNASGDAHLSALGGVPLLFWTAVSQLKRLDASNKVRLVADNANGYIQAYINGVEKTECRIDLDPASGVCTNCVGNSTNAGQRYVTDIFIPVDSFFQNEVNYAWYETRTVNGLPRDVHGVSKMSLCRDTTAGFSALSHTDLFSSDPSSSTLLSGAVIKVRTIPNNLAASNDMYSNFATLGSDFMVTKHNYESDGSYKRVCNGFQDSTLAVYQDHHDTGGAPVYGDLYTIEKDATHIHLRKYGTTGTDAGKLKATLFSDLRSSLTAFKQGTSLSNQWIVVVPTIATP